MSDILFFLSRGWNNIWKQKTIWLFSALPVLIQLFYPSQFNHENNWVWSFLLLVAGLISLIISSIGVPYLAYCFSIGNPATIEETLFAIKKFFWRVIGCSCLGVLILSPLIIWVIAIAIYNSSHTLQIPNKGILAFLPLSIFSAVYSFTMIAFFENDTGINKSLKEAWNLFIKHFSVLAMLGIILTLMGNIYLAISGILTVLIQSGFDITSLGTLNFINLPSTLSNNGLYLSLSGIFQIISPPFYASVFTLAYLKYSGKGTFIYGK